MRWQIEKSKSKIVSYNFEGHEDHVEVSGKEISCVIKYGVNGGAAKVGLTLVFPQFRIQQQNTTKAHLMFDVTADVIGGNFEKVEFDGNLHILTGSDGVKVRHSFYPSVNYPAFYERIEIFNGGNKSVNYELKSCRLDNRFCCEGFAYIEKTADKEKDKKAPGLFNLF